jgi:hypothetical protein
VTWNNHGRPAASPTLNGPTSADSSPAVNALPTSDSRPCGTLAFQIVSKYG